MFCRHWCFLLKKQKRKKADLERMRTEMRRSDEKIPENLEFPSC